MTGPAVPLGGEELREAARLSPDGTLVAVQHGPNDWRVSNGGHYRDAHVADWTPLLALPAVRDALAAQEAVKRVEFAVNEFYWLAENGHTVIDTARIRRALAGEP